MVHGSTLVDRTTSWLRLAELIDSSFQLNSLTLKLKGHNLTPLDLNTLGTRECSIDWFVMLKLQITGEPIIDKWKRFFQNPFYMKSRNTKTNHRTGKNQIDGLAKTKWTDSQTLLSFKYRCPLLHILWSVLRLGFVSLERYYYHEIIKNINHTGSYILHREKGYIEQNNSIHLQ